MKESQEPEEIKSKDEQILQADENKDIQNQFLGPEYPHPDELKAAQMVLEHIIAKNIVGDVLDQMKGPRVQNCEQIMDQLKESYNSGQTGSPEYF